MTSFLMAVLVLAALTLPLLAQPDAQSTDVEIRNVDADESSYEVRERVRIVFEVRDNRGTEDETLADYRAVIVILDPDGDEVYDSNSAGEDERFTLEAGETGDASFTWDVPADAEPGQYSIIGSLRSWDSFNEVHDEWELRDGSGFEVDEGIVIFLSDTEHDFGTVTPGDTPNESFIVLNEGNGDLEWQVTSWPDSWLDLLRPEPDTIVTNQGIIEVEVRENAPFGNLDGEIVIDTNVGERVITVEAFLEGNPAGEVARVRSELSQYRTGENAVLTVSVDNTGDVIIDFRVVVSVFGPTGSMVFNSNTEGLDGRIVLEEGEDGDVNVVWPIPPGTLDGTHRVTVDLRAWNDFGLLLYETPDGEIEEDFMVIPGPRLRVEPTSLSFGRFDQGETPEAAFEVTNTGVGVLTWSVENAPDWVQVVSPDGATSGDGEVWLRVDSDAPGGNISGSVRITSNGGDADVRVSAVVVPPPTPTRTRTPIPTPSATPTPVPPPPTSTPTPVVISPLVLTGRIVIPDGLVPQDAVLVARIGEYESLAAIIEGQEFKNLIVLPDDPALINSRVAFYLDGIESETPLRPVIFTPGAVRTVNLIFNDYENALPFPTPSPTPSRSPTPVPPSSTPSPTATATPTITATPSPTPVTPTATPRVIVEVVTPTTQQPTSTPEPASGSCSATSAHIPSGAKAINLLSLIGPVLLPAGMIAWRRKSGR